MSDFTDQILGVSIDLEGNRRLENQTFVKESFPELVLGPIQSIYQSYNVSDCVFRDCVVTPGDFRISHGVELHRVVFNNVLSSDLMTISTTSLLDEVVIQGGPKSRGIWVKPFGALTADFEQTLRSRMDSMAQNVSVMLDISAYFGKEVAIIGLPVEKVIYDSSRHFAITRAWCDVDWDRLEIPKTSFWRIRVLALDDFDVDSGIFNLPRPGDRKYEERMREMIKLKELGLV